MPLVWFHPQENFTKAEIFYCGGEIMEVIYNKYHGYDLHETRNLTTQNDIATFGKAWFCVCFLHQFSSRKLTQEWFTQKYHDVMLHEKSKQNITFENNLGDIVRAWGNLQKISWCSTRKIITIGCFVAFSFLTLRLWKTIYFL